MYFPGQYLSGRVLIELKDDTPALGKSSLLEVIGTIIRARLGKVPTRCTSTKFQLVYKRRFVNLIMIMNIFSK